MLKIRKNMLNFNYFNPVNVVFGKDTIKEIANLIEKDKKVLMVYGGGSIKKNGVYDQVKEALKDHSFIEFSGIEANPSYETCMKAVEVVKKENVDFLLAVGGGSVLDGTKFIAAAAKLDCENVWKTLMIGTTISFPELESALPLGCVITLPATGSEMNCGSVISKKATSEKKPFISSVIFPKFSIIDPETTYSLPKKQVINGIVDTYIHTIEQYVTYDVDSPLQDRQSEGILKTLLEETDKLLSDTPEYNSRANFFWCATQALNGLIGSGVAQDWSVHMMGHELTAFYGLDHGQSLAIVQTRVWRNRKEAKKAKLIQYGNRIFDINETDEDKAIDLVIEKTLDFFHKLGIKTNLSDYGIDPKDAAEKVSSRFTERGTVLGENQDITPEIVKEILLNC
jgi:NADP-dependent alcohol dehydrogenase